MGVQVEITEVHEEMTQLYVLYMDFIYFKMK